MKKHTQSKLSIVKRKIAKLNNPHLILGGDEGLTTETKTKIKYKCVNGSKDFVLVVVDQ